MKIEVQYYHGVEKSLSASASRIRQWEVPSGTTVKQFLNLLGIPDDLPVVVIIDGVVVERGRILKPGDLPVIMLPAGGG